MGGMRALYPPGRGPLSLVWRSFPIRSSRGTGVRSESVSAQSCAEWFTLRPMALPTLFLRHIRRTARRTACLLLTSLFPLSCALAASDVPAVAAAADLKFALTDIAARFEKESGRQLKLTFGSSGNFANQIAQRAPFELFLSADEGFVFRLADAGLTEDRGTLYSIGRIVLFVPKASPVRPEVLLSDLPGALADGRVRHFAIANPEHAPYGRAARAALRRMGAWAAIEPRLVLGENAAQAAQFAVSGSTQGGIIPLSLAISPELSRLGSYAPIPAAWHADEPLRQRMVLMKNAGETARAFYRYLQTPAVRALFAGYGFVLPDDAAK